MPLYNVDARLARPIRVHTLTDAAEAARVAVRRFAHQRRVERDTAAIVVQYGQLKREHDEPMPKSAADVVRDAGLAGFEVRASRGYWTVNLGKSNERDVPAWQVAAMHREKRIGFRAIWADGTAKDGGWYAPAVEWVGIAEVKARLAALLKAAL